MSHKETKRELEHVMLSTLTPYVRNSRTHSPQQVKQIAASIREFGFTNPILIDEDGTIIAGHGRVLAAEHLQMKEVPAIRLAYLSDAQKRAYVIADNKIAENAGWDEEMLKIELSDLHSDGYDLGIIGFEPEELLDILELDTDIDKIEQDRDRSDGTLLDASNVTIDDPKTEVTKGQVWRLGRHRLIITDVITQFKTYSRFLNDDTLFCPYGSPYVLLGPKADTKDIVIVQPDRYIAGHIIDRFRDIYGDTEVGVIE